MIKEVQIYVIFYLCNKVPTKFAQNLHSHLSKQYSSKKTPISITYNTVFQ